MTRMIKRKRRTVRRTIRMNLPERRSGLMQRASASTAILWEHCSPSSTTSRACDGAGSENEERDDDEESSDDKPKGKKSWFFGFAFFGSLVITKVPYANVPLDVNYRVARDFVAAEEEEKKKKKVKRGSRFGILGVVEINKVTIKVGLYTEQK
jgi:hypothetical protein